MKRTQDRSYILPKPKTTESRGKQSWLYRTKQWLAIKEAFIKLNPLCYECKRCGITRASEEVDHIDPVPQGATIRQFLNLSIQDNLGALCSGHHARKTRLDQIKNNEKQPIVNT